MERKKVLVTGGAGFIGSHFSEYLFKNGYDVILIDNFNEYYDPNLKYKNEKEVQLSAQKYEASYILYKGDIRNAVLLNDIFEKNEVHAVVAFAANAGVRPSIESPLYYVDVNIMGLTLLLETMRNHYCRSLVFISSSSVYGNNKKVPFSEKDIVDFPISPYAATKKAGELICHTYHSLYNLSVVCLRYFTVYGPRQRPDLAINKFTQLIDKGEVIPMYGDGTTARDYTYISDIVEGTFKAMEYVMKSDPVYDVFNLGGSNPIKLYDLIMVISKAMKKEVTIEKLPMQAGDVNITYSDYTHAKEILDYEPQININDGIKQFVDWYLGNKNEV